VLGGGYPWKLLEQVRTDLASEFQFGPNLKTYLYGGSILAVLIVFLSVIRNELKAGFKKST
jgi:hypothetical protein